MKDYVLPLKGKFDTIQIFLREIWASDGCHVMYVGLKEAAESSEGVLSPLPNYVASNCVSVTLLISLANEALFPRYCLTVIRYWPHFPSCNKPHSGLNRLFTCKWCRRTKWHLFTLFCIP